MTNNKRRSDEWFGAKDLEGFLHRSGLRAQGFSEESFSGKPVIGIANSWSELTHCNSHLRDLANHVKRGVISAGGFPLEFPTISLGEFFLHPTSMLYRNLMAMDVEIQPKTGMMIMMDSMMMQTQQLQMIVRMYTAYQHKEIYLDALIQIMMVGRI